MLASNPILNCFRGAILVTSGIWSFSTTVEPLESLWANVNGTIEFDVKRINEKNIAFRINDTNKYYVHEMKRVLMLH